MISSLFFSNFQSLMFPQEIKLAPLTLLVGSNAVGKSSIGRSVRLMQQSFRHRAIHFNGDLVDLTSFGATVSNNKESDEMRIGIGTDEYFDVKGVRFYPEVISYDLHDNGGSPTVKEISVSVRFSIVSGSGEDMEAHEIEAAVSDPFRDPKSDGVLRFQGTWEEGPASKRAILVEAVEGKEALVGWFNQVTVGSDPALTSDEPDPFLGATTAESLLAVPWIIPWGFSNGLKRRKTATNARTADAFATMALSSVLDQSIETYEQICERTLSVGPVRVVSSAFHEMPARPTSDSPQLSGNGDNLQEVASAMSDDQFGAVSNQLLRLTEGRFSLARKVATTEEPSFPRFGIVMLMDNNKQNKTLVAFKDAGSGLTQILPFVIMSMRQPSNPSVIRGFKPGRVRASKTGNITFVEQPELHMHPQMQGELGDFLIEATAESSELGGSRRGQIIAETHSEAVIMRVLRRIREGKLSKDDVSIVAIDKFEGGGSLAQQCRISDDGSLIDDLPISFSSLRMNDALGRDS